VKVLVDTSVWVEHLRAGSAELARMLEDDEVLTHRFVIEELACGRLARRAEILELFGSLPRAAEAEHAELLRFIEANGLEGAGIGAVDAHLLASARLEGASLWTKDAALARAAARLGAGR
jgi:predicted nucleic acid-binding protein